jgi:hypothetical protein
MNNPNENESNNNNNTFSVRNSTYQNNNIQNMNVNQLKIVLKKLTFLGKYQKQLNQKVF